MFSSLVQAACIGFSEGLLRSVKYLSVPKANVKIQMFLGTSVPCLCSYACALLNGPFATHLAGIGPWIGMKHRLGTQTTGFLAVKNVDFLLENDYDPILVPLNWVTNFRS
jgi:hypothetical protein